MSVKSMGYGGELGTFPRSCVFGFINGTGTGLFGGVAGFVSG